MKSFIVALAILPLFLGACASVDSTEYNHTGAAGVRGNLEPSEHRPHLGMTRDEVLSLYGKPISKLYGPKGEAWKYWFNRSATIWIGSRPRLAIIIFDEKGRVKDFLWNAE